MSRHTGPRAGSAACKVICRLVDLGGTAKISVLMEVVGAEYSRVITFKEKIANVLDGFSFAELHGDSLTATLKGKEYAADIDGTYLPLPQKYVGQIAPPRLPSPQKPLDLARLFTPTLVRDGAFDHQQIPSLMGGTRKLPSGKVVS
ncbi:hypothetical protein RGU72_05270 [Undibacterium sp. 5I1]|uniref:hypothetical protein n=1 Tax=Undibacterium sp. 5I1 TaxID=3048590 RepID=UPI002AB4E4F7|nr:hypothetical protein [Undibacterium sp. 5I1]MDY7537663.1 hypothetical protein [Undibacterium sp. 5I1]MEB0256400.1 hypothetical protein [Undibacterium sp. 5I1]